MNSQNAHLYLPLVQAVIAGKVIEHLDGHGNWHECCNPNFVKAPEAYRIRPLAFPPLPDGCTWHNPDNLTAEQVGEEWRLLTSAEICEDPPAYKACHCWLPSNEWSNGSPYYGNSSSCTYRVPISTPFPDGSRIVDGKLVKPEPPKPVPLEPADVPPGSVFRCNSIDFRSEWQMAISITDTGVDLYRSDVEFVKFVELMDGNWQILRPSKTEWEACSK